MRVSSLSDARVIDLLSRYFVPVWLSRDHYQLEPPAKEEQDELERIDRERRRRGFEGGTVSVNVLAPDGSILATQPVQKACHPENLVPFLEGLVEKEHLRPRPEAANRAAPVKAKAPGAEGGKVLRVWARVDRPGAPNRGVGSDRVELTAAEWKQFLPPSDARPGTSWQVPERVAHHLFQHFYPPGPHWRLEDSKVQKGVLTASVASVSDDEVRVRLEGRLVLIYPASRPESGGRMTAHVVGFLHCSPGGQAPTAFVMASEEAEYVWYWEGKLQPGKMRIAVEMEP
jgi:hypothetical protein